MRHIHWLTLSIVFTGCNSERPPTAGGKSSEFWTKEIQSGDVKARKKAALKLGNLGVADPSVVPALIAALKDRDASVRAEAVLALRKIGPSAQEAVPALTQAQTDRDPAVRSYATKALEKIQGGG